MKHRSLTISAVAMGILLVWGCEAPSDPALRTSETLDEGTFEDAAVYAAKARKPHALGGGHYELLLAGEAFPGKFLFVAVQSDDDGAHGYLRFVLDLMEGIPDVIAGGVVDIRGRVTCLTIDAANGRAWIGGVVTRNRSTQPDYRDDATTQVGKDVWFRVLDNGEGRRAEPDRTTFVGFEGGAGIITSEEYCETMPWPDDNARTNPVTRGNIQVKP